jgi:hypothetical protein
MILSNRKIGRPARLILLIGMLASLCFSVGEGISLLPFPSSVKNDAAQLSGGAPLRIYSPSLHDSGSGLMRLIKLKRNQKRDPNPFSHGPATTANLGSPSARNHRCVDEVNHRVVQPLRASVAGRAPPSC